MRETLRLDPRLDGTVQHHRNTGRALRPHRHAELEVNLVARGRASYLMSDRRYDLRRGTQIWLFADQDHVLVNQTADCEIWVAVFRPQAVERMTGDDPARRVLRETNPPGNFARQLPASVASRLGVLFAELTEITNDPARFNAGLAYAMLHAWHAHLAADELPGGRGQDIHPSVEMAARLVRDNAKPMNLEELADRCGLCASRLSSVFKRQTGVSLVSYRQRMCLERFLKIYGMGRRKSMMRAALEAGFGSYPQFHRVFKQHMRLSPAAYRRDVNDADVV